MRSAVMRRALALATCTLLAAVPLGVAAQWQGYPTPKIPRTAENYGAAMARMLAPPW